MTPVLTLVSSDPAIPLCEEHIKIARSAIQAYNGEFEDEITWLSEGKALDQAFANVPPSMVARALQAELHSDQIDVFASEAGERRKKLLLADMDSTIVTGETLDDLAEYAGLKDEISAITARAMEGHLDFEEALNERVGLLKGLSKEALNGTLEAIKLSAGAETFVKTMAAHGAHCVLVSGGFTFFTEKIAKRAGFEAHHGNVLELEEGALTGKVIPPILDKNAKLRFLGEYAQKHNLDLSEALTIGDGANDLPMLEAAGLGIGYHPKDTVKKAIHNCIIHGDLTSALYAQGYSESDFTT